MWVPGFAGVSPILMIYKQSDKMKKIFLTGAVLMAMTFASCGGSKNDKAAGGDSVALEEVEIETVGEVVADSVTGDATDNVAAEGQGILDKLKNSKAGAEAVALAGQAKDYIVKLVSSGKIDEAKRYFAQVGPYIQEKAPKVYDSIKAVLDSDQLEAVKSKAADMVDKAKDKGSEMKDAAKDKAADLKDKAADKLKGAF